MDVEREWRELGRDERQLRRRQQQLLHVCCILLLLLRAHMSAVDVTTSQ